MPAMTNIEGVKPQLYSGPLHQSLFSYWRLQVPIITKFTNQAIAIVMTDNEVLMPSQHIRLSAHMTFSTSCQMVGWIARPT